MYKPFLVPFELKNIEGQGLSRSQLFGIKDTSMENQMLVVSLESKIISAMTKPAFYADWTGAF